MLNVDPLNPVWGPRCPWGLGYGHFGGGSGPFFRLETGFFGHGPNRQKTVWAELGATGEFLGLFWLIGTVFALRRFLTLTTLGGFTRGFREKRDLLGFKGFGHLEKFRAQPTKKFGQKKSKKC